MKLIHNNFRTRKRISKYRRSTVSSSYTLFTFELDINTLKLSTQRTLRMILNKKITSKCHLLHDFAPGFPTDCPYGVLVLWINYLPPVR